VPPFAAGTTPSDSVGVVVGFTTASGLVAPTAVTPPPVPGSPRRATSAQSGPSNGTTATLARRALQDEPSKLTASRST
jgi:hypothetical protein